VRPPFRILRARRGAESCAVPIELQKLAATPAIVQERAAERQRGGRRAGDLDAAQSNKHAYPQIDAAIVLSGCARGEHPVRSPNVFPPRLARLGTLGPVTVTNVSQPRNGYLLFT